MNPIKPRSGPSHTVEEQQEAAQALRSMSPAQYYQAFNWNLQDLDGLEHGLFTKVTSVASVGNVRVLEDLIHRGADLTKRSQGDFTALHAAVQAKQLSAATCLLGTTFGSQLATSTCEGGLTPLMLACNSTVPLALAKVLVPLSDLAATDNGGRSVRKRAEDADRGDIVTFLDLASHSHAVPALSNSMAPPLPDTLEVVNTFREVARDLPEWLDRVELSELQEMKRCWKNLLTAHRQTTTAARQGDTATLRAVHEMKALRIRILQRTPLAPVTRLTINEDQRVRSEQIMVKIREGQDRFFRAGVADETAQASGAAAPTDLHPFPLSVSLVPVQLVLVAAQRQLEVGFSTPQEAEAILAHAIDEGDAIIAQRQARETSPDAQQDSPPTLQELRHNFELLKQQIEGDAAARSIMFDAEPVSRLLKVIATLESKRQLSEEQLQDFCRNLQKHFLELNAAFQRVAGV